MHYKQTYRVENLPSAIRHFSNVAPLHDEVVRKYHEQRKRLRERSRRNEGDDIQFYKNIPGHSTITFRQLWQSDHLRPARNAYSIFFSEWHRESHLENRGKCRI